jgi:membrane dipeptidase
VNDPGPEADGPAGPPGGRPGNAPGDVDDAPEALHRAAYVFDGHNDLALRLLDGEDPTERLADGHLDLPRAREGGLDGGIFAVWVDPEGTDPLGRTLRGVEALTGWLDAAPGIRPVLDAGDLERAERAGEIAAVVGVEGGYGVRQDLRAAARLFEFGVRCLTLTWMEPTDWADAAGAPPRHGGLTPFGARLVDRLQELGIVVDVSHASDRATARVLERAEGPVIASHSGARAVADHPRNLPDGLLEGVAATGGAVGVNFFPGYLDAAYGERFEPLRRGSGPDVFTPRGRAALEEEVADLDPVGLDRVAEHLEHVASVAGAEAVGLGSDFDGAPTLPEGMEDVRDLPRLTRRLMERGWSPPSVRAALGSNLRRVLSELLP